jgi:hypothetical protein
MLVEVFPPSTMLHEFRWSFCTWKKFLHLLLKKSPYQILGKGCTKYKVCVSRHSLQISVPWCIDSSHDVIKFDVLYLSFYFFIQSSVENMILNDSFLMLWFRNLFFVCVCVFKSPYHHYQTASTSVYHRAQLDLIQDFTLPSLAHNFQYIYFNQKPSLQVTNTRFLCGYIWLNRDTKTWIPSMWCRKSHINPYTLILKSTVGISTLYMILGGQKRNLPSDIHALRIFVVFCWRAP